MKPQDYNIRAGRVRVTVQIDEVYNATRGSLKTPEYRMTRKAFS
jgi:hypothetical protein